MLRNRRKLSCALLSLCLALCGAEESLRAQFDQTLSAQASNAGGVMFIGDSDVEFWRDSEYAPHDSSSLINGSSNVGVAGATCAEVSGWVGEALSQLTPSAVVLVCGENDLDGSTPAQAFASFQSIYQAVAATGVRVFFLSTKPEPGTTEYHASYQEYDQLVRNYAASISNATSSPLVFIDSYNGFLDVGNSDCLYDGDMLHLSELGYELWGSWLTTAMAGDASCYTWLSGAGVAGCTGETGAPTAAPAALPTGCHKKNIVMIVLLCVGGALCVCGIGALVYWYMKCRSQVRAGPEADNVELKHVELTHADAQSSTSAEMHTPPGP